MKSPEHDALEERFCTLPSGVVLCYRTHGQRTGEPLLLIAGLGLDLSWWPPSLVDALTRRGFYVITFDNRDAGRSSKMSSKAPGLFRLASGAARADGYDLGDMAADTAGLLDTLRIPNAHVLGMSMGGMIAQTLAARYPARVRTLVSVFSTTGHKRVGQPALSTLLRMLQRPALSEAQAITRSLKVLRHITAGPLPFEEEEARAYGARSWLRSGGARAEAGFRRQINAIMKSGDRTSELKRISAPTLVLHGDVDRMVHPSGGRATARAITGAKFMTVHGMRHSLPRALVARVAALIAGHALLRDGTLAAAVAMGEMT